MMHFSVWITYLFNLNEFTTSELITQIELKYTSGSFSALEKTAKKGAADRINKLPATERSSTSARGRF